MQKTWNKLIILSFIFISLAAGVALRKFVLDYEYLPGLLEVSREETDVTAIFRERFPVEQVLMVAVEDGAMTDKLAFRVLEHLEARPGIAVVGAESIRLPFLDGEDLYQSSLRERFDPETIGLEVRELFKSDPFIRNLFSSPDDKARLLYVYDLLGERPAVFMERVRRALPDKIVPILRFWGGPNFYETLKAKARQDSLLLIPLAALIALLMHYAMVRSWGIALCLWVTSILPTFWTMALYPLSGSVFRNDSILVPIEVLALSTSYAIQLFRFATLEAGSSGSSNRRGIMGVIVFSGITTIMGIASLFAVPVSSVRETAGFMIAGIVFSLIVSLVLLPVLLGLLPSYRTYQSKPARKLHAISRTFWLGPLLSAFILITALGSMHLKLDFDGIRMFRSFDSYSGTAKYFHDRFGGMDELELLINSDESYYFYKPSAYADLRFLADVLRQEAGIGSVMDAAGFMDWIFRRMNQGDGLPVTMEQIGETAEFAGGSGPGLSISSLLAVDASAARLLIRFSLDDGSSFGDFRNMVLSKAHSVFPEARVGLAGAYDSRWVLRNELGKGILQGIVWFLPSLFVFMLIVFRSVRLAILAITPPAVALGVYFGFSGWMGVGIDPITAIGAAVVMGVGVDDVIHLLLTAKNARRDGLGLQQSYEYAVVSAGGSILQTTLIIVVSVSVLFLSAFHSVFWTGILSALGLIVATAVTIVLIPVLGSWQMIHKGD
jgi:hypothetical protein